SASTGGARTARCPRYRGNRAPATESHPAAARKRGTTPAEDGAIRPWPIAPPAFPATSRASSIPFHLELVVKESQHLLDGLSQFLAAPAVALAFQLHHLGRRADAFQLLRQHARMTDRHQLVLGAVKEQERRRTLFHIDGRRCLLVRLSLVAKRAAQERCQERFLQLVAPGFHGEVGRAEEAHDRL